jgi:N-acetyl-gamma-glutamyl-phosphate reductase
MQEIRKENSGVTLTFIPHLLPIFSGIQSNIYFDSQIIDAEEVYDTLKNFYQNEIFVRIFKNKIPKLSEVQNTNYIRIGVFSDLSKKKTIIISTIDNLVKGAAGQAIQNMNLMFGFNESESLM